MSQPANKNPLHAVWHHNALWTALYSLVVLCGCSTSPECVTIDEAFVMTLLMESQLAPQLEPSNNLKVTTPAEPQSVIAEPKVQPSLEGATSIEYIDELPCPITDSEAFEVYQQNKAEIDKILAKDSEQTTKDAVLTWLAIQAIKKHGTGDRELPSQAPVIRGGTPDITPVTPDTTGASNDSAANEGVSRPIQPAAKEATSAAAPASRPLAFYEIILHTGDNCAPCDVLKHELKLRGIQFDEHRVKAGKVPVAFIDGVEYVGAKAIYKRLEIQRTK